MPFCMKRGKKKAKKYKKNKVVPKNLEYKSGLSPSKNILLEEYVEKINSYNFCNISSTFKCLYQKIITYGCRD